MSITRKRASGVLIVLLNIIFAVTSPAVLVLTL